MREALAGALMIASALFAALLEAHYRGKKAWDRPRWTLTATYRALFRPAWILVLVAGLALLALASWIVATAVAAALAAFVAARRRSRSPSVLAGTLEARARSIASRRPDLPHADALVDALLERHPEWGRELAEQIVRDAGDAASVARIVTRMEEGWPGR